ncbi:MAG: hypothetical protein WD795_05320 [Woeseia sp.]
MTFSTIADYCRQAQRRLDELVTDSSELAAWFDLAAVAESVCSLWQYRGYNNVPPEISAIWAQVHEQFGKKDAGLFNRMLLYKLISTSAPRLLKADLPQRIVHDYEEAFDRILRKLEMLPSPYSDPDDDVFLKDLGISAQTVFVAGYYVLNPGKRINRKLLFSGGLGQFLRFFWLSVLKYRRTGPFLLAHCHDDHKAKFTPEGRVETFKTIVEFLIRRPEYKAVVGSAWYYDPVLRSISPHLAYVRHLPEANGAYFFRGLPTMHNGVFTSKSRRRLFEDGKYVPRNYTMVWPRDRLISWAARLAEGTTQP